MAVQHITSLLTSLNLPEEITKACKTSINSVNSAFIIRLTTNSISFPERRQRFKPKPAIEEPPPAVAKPKIDKKTRDENFEELKKKTEESKDFTKKLIEDRIERQKRNQEREREFRMKTMQEMEEQRKQQEEIIKKLEEEKLSKLNEMAKKSEQRKKVLEEQKEISKSPVATKPLFKQMEDAYKQKVLMPQLEHHKAELAKKRINYQPLNPDELKEHSRNHEELKRQFEYRRKKELEQKQLDSQLNMASNSMQSKFTVAVLEEEKRKKEEQERKEYEKKLNINKRLQYSKLVKEMFVPVVGENNKIPEAVATKFKNKVRSADNDRNSEKKKIGVTDYKSDIGLRPARIKKKEEEIKKEVEVVDYLANKRKARESRPKEFKALHVELQKDIEDDEIDSAKLQMIKAKAEKIDKQAKLREGAIGRMNKDGVKGIQAGDEVNDMIISSIRAKLALLGKFQSK